MKNITFRVLLPILVVLAILAVATAHAPLVMINALTPFLTYSKSSDIAYGPYARQKLDVYVPPSSTGKAPVVVFFYGGSWNSGDRGNYAFVGEALASRGFVAVIADYRLYPEVRYPDFLEDAAAAVAWTVRKIGEAGGDPERIYLMGHSAGAYNAAMLALDRRWLKRQGIGQEAVRGWIGLAGPYDFIPIKNPAVRPVFFHPDTPSDSQPVNHVTQSAPPALLIAPQVDELVDPRRNTGGLAARLRDAGAPVTEIYFDSISHVSLVATLSRPLRALAPTLDAVEYFVRKDSRRPPVASASH